MKNYEEAIKDVNSALELDTDKSALTLKSEIE
jgi:hypothetical protein